MDIQHAEIHNWPCLLAACNWTVMGMCCLRSLQRVVPPASTARELEKGPFAQCSHSIRSIPPNPRHYLAMAFSLAVAEQLSWARNSCHRALP